MKLKGLHFADVAEVQEAVTDKLKKVQKDEFLAAFQKLYDCAKACIYMPMELILKLKKRYVSSCVFDLKKKQSYNVWTALGTKAQELSQFRPSSTVTETQFRIFFPTMRTKTPSTNPLYPSLVVLHLAARTPGHHGSSNLLLGATNQHPVLTATCKADVG
jgi:hypothetical protein